MMIGKPWMSGEPPGSKGWRQVVLALLACSLPAACTSNEAKSDVPECVQPQTAECSAARDRFQVLNYDVPAERLVAAASRAAGDLNFELVRRDDAAGVVLARYVGDAPTHKDQLDSRFHSALKDAAAQPLLAHITLGTASTAGAIPVRVQLLMPPVNGAAQAPLDRIAPYQLFFEELSLELDGRVAPPPEDDSDKDRDRHPHKPANLPGSASVPVGL